MINIKVERFQKSILHWYQREGRHFPWRETDDPFKIFVAEFLLQKTDAEKVKTVYGAFVRRWNTPKTLSDARISSISKMIKPLGLKYRARRMKLSAKFIVEKCNGKIPKSEVKLLELPGVGHYISSAVECFAFGKPKAVLDTNIIRIFNRVFGIQSSKKRPRDDPHFWDLAQKFVPVDRSREYNWGLLDYGALICRSKKPLCGECVIQGMCLFYKKLRLKIK
ncbi:A/G-specific adenine glycosylase [bacterium]|nr:A/G-specific adenine glycosylase [bacterium]